MCLPDKGYSFQQLFGCLWSDGNTFDQAVSPIDLSLNKLSFHIHVIGQVYTYDMLQPLSETFIRVHDGFEIHPGVELGVARMFVFSAEQ